MARRLTLEALAAEADTSPELISRLTEIGVVRPDDAGLYTAGDVIRLEAVDTFLDAGIGLEQVESALAEGLFTFEFLDRFHPEPAPLSDRTYAEFAESIGSRAGILPAVYSAMGLPEPPAGRSMRTDEEEILTEFLETWSAAGDDETYVRAARLVGEPARMMSEGWTRLYVEKMSAVLDTMERDARIATIVETTERAATLGPRMLVWLVQRQLRHAIDAANVEGLERALTEMGLSLPRPIRPPAVAFVDISGYTSLTERHGDELAAGIATSLRGLAEQAARPRGGSVVKLLGDGVMLHFEDAVDAVAGVVDLMSSLREEGLEAHAGISAGALIERDGDYYGRTANLASRLAGVAGPGEVVVNDSVMSAAKGSTLRFEPVRSGVLKGIDRPVDAYRVNW